jgi:5-methyltetrahydropteroyltriglutamate--homocysteine methyltransferase
VKYIHPDCGFWMLKRSIADAKIRALARGRDLFEGRQTEASGAVTAS